MSSVSLVRFPSEWKAPKFLFLTGASSVSTIQIQPSVSSFHVRPQDSELEECECAPRYRPDSLEALRRATRFSESELKRIYRGFKAECPTGVVREDTFKGIYSQFFPQGGKAFTLLNGTR
ncbi:hypothetical protein J437_LFUL007206 [Ladona fulva]|uniref:Uncharacterized protein n=1 Tax=Ladona fulva TaxID=123851 RepID=A0A8K0P005_LADFU|nr:hypothetical protein J437_LFUL007206 [Ladona fulva]